MVTHHAASIITEIGAISPEMAYWVIKDKLGWELEDAAGENVKGV